MTVPDHVSRRCALARPEVSPVTIRPVYAEVLLLCPQLVTANAQALHQLACTINALGGSAKLAYYGRSRIELNGSRLRCHHVLDVPVQRAYAHYVPTLLDEVALDARTFVIIPETETALARKLAPLPRGIWWLSVDSAMKANPRLTQPRYMAQLMSDHTLVHFYRCGHARQFLEAHGARQILPLSAYIEALPVRHIGDPAARAVPQYAPDALIGVSGRTGIAAARRFAVAANGLNLMFLDGLTHRQTRSVLSECAVYIDFGQQPGRDRVVLEAAGAGALVFLHTQGAGACVSDHPLDPYFLFNESDVNGGVLLSRLRHVLARYDTHWPRQCLYRQRIRMGQEEFALQVKTFFMSAEHVTAGTT